MGSYTSSSAIAATALHGGSVLAKSGRQYSADSIGLSSTTVTYACEGEAFHRGKTTVSDSHQIRVRVRVRVSSRVRVAVRFGSFSTLRHCYNFSVTFNITLRSIYGTGKVDSVIIFNI